MYNIKNEIKKLENKHSEYREQILNYMNKKSKYEIETNNYICKKNTTTKESFPTKILKEQYPDLFDRYVIKNSYDILSIKEKKQRKISIKKSRKHSIKK